MKTKLWQIKMTGCLLMSLTTGVLSAGLSEKPAALAKLIINTNTSQDSTRTACFHNVTTKDNNDKIESKHKNCTTSLPAKIKIVSEGKISAQLKANNLNASAVAIVSLSPVVANVQAAVNASVH